MNVPRPDRPAPHRADSARREVGLVGVGRMGLSICARLVEMGFIVVATDVRPELRAAVIDVGAQWVDSLIGVGGCGVVITVLPGPAEVTDTRDALLAVLASGSVWIDMSSATPAVAAEIAAAASRRRVRTLDAPIGGGPRQARDGDLLTFVGGRLSDVDDQRPILDALSTTVIHVGAAGSGYAVKLLVNLLWFGQAVANAEVLALAVRAGLNPETVRLAVQQSAAATRFMEHDARALMRGDDLISFSLARCVEELDGVLTLAGELEVPMALGHRVAELYTAALERYGSVDGELLAARYVAEQANVDFAQREFGPAAGSDAS